MSKIFRPLVFYIGLRYVYGQKTDGFGRFVSWLSMIGIMLGSIGLIVVLSVMNGLENQMQNSILKFFPQAQITSTQGRIDPNLTPSTLFNSIKGVNRITPLVTGDVILQSEQSITVSTLMGITAEDEDPINDYIYSGSIADLQAGQYNVILGQTLANQLGVTVGDKIRLMVTDASQITPVGRIPSQRLFNIVGLFSVNHDINQALIYINQSDARNLLRYPANMITSWRLFLDNPLNIAAVTNTPLPDGLIFNDWRAKRGELFQAIKMEKNVMGLLISLIVIVAAFNIITSLSLLVMEKQGEVAILKTQGLSRFKIMLIFIIQGASSGVMGTLLGSIIGLILALNLNELMQVLGLSFAGIELPSLVEPSQIIFIIIGLLMLSLISTIYPAYRAANIQPAEALRYE
ncbi:lipoprotein-releasing ABC transporter permease subunit LolC [Gilliamella sp. B2969]|nr:MULTISPECIES: lipoprotein-releasing ABC transporter permease subunit LolC [unclassified Gilliamella]MCX8712010.1 lipoprotein-releasing ABC transporter permease subunit LolC [Gilliamella sp. B3468]MCX8727431.1 lipoprotein-releasing ABC transporter permease subunit LolC [Gilliamella sp. B2838]MCX8730951.1 lipoprotein-releasing ABC transporter permease subunit LolC [Gilliamella sp. B2969]MCX8738974.1 lipoprotein-releasing ABC transporter permease subunit LolC [Gilliamella sp. B2824]MCX8751445.